MDSDPNRWLSVELDHGGWYVEPLDHHLFLHIARNVESGQLFLVTTTSHDILSARSVVTEGEVVATISLYDLLEITRKVEASAGKSAEAPLPGT